MEIRGHKDILAVRDGEGIFALHARNLEVASLSEEAWTTLSPMSLLEAQAQSLPQSSAALNDLLAWEASNSTEISEDTNRFGVRSLVINITQICNLHCDYCAAGGDGTYGDPITKISIEKTIPQLKFFLSQVPKGERFHISFLGGEPLLYPQILGALAHYVLSVAETENLTPSFKVTTNGTLVTPEALNVLRGMRAHVTVSLDGPAAIHDRQRKTRSNEGTFENALTGLLLLLSHRQDLASVGINSVFNDLHTDVETTWTTLSQLPVDYLEFTYSVSPQNHEATQRFNASLAKTLDLAWQKGGDTELRRINNIREIFDRLDEQKRRLNHCGLGKNFLVVDSRNRLWNCPWTVGQKDNQLGSGTELDYDRFEKYQKSQIEMNGCESCWARFLCGGGCSFIHGSTKGTATEKKIDFCQRTRFLMAQALVYYGRSRALGAHS